MATWGAVLKAPRCVLAGDHLQLPPTVISDRAARQARSDPAPPHPRPCCGCSLSTHGIPGRVSYDYIFCWIDPSQGLGLRVSTSVEVQGPLGTSVDPQPIAAYRPLTAHIFTACRDGASQRHRRPTFRKRTSDALLHAHGALRADPREHHLLRLSQSRVGSYEEAW